MVLCKKKGVCVCVCQSFLVTKTFLMFQIHQEEFKGDAPTFVESQFSFDPSPSPAEFYIYIPNPIDPKVNKVELTSPQGVKYTDQLSVLHDINVIKIDARIDQPGTASFFTFFSVSSSDKLLITIIYLTIR